MEAVVRSFRDLDVWRKAHGLFLNVARDVERFPRKRAALVVADQLLRAVGSVSANIAEGFGRHVGPEFQHYLIVARGSLTESENWFLKCRDLGFLRADVFAERDEVCRELLRMLNAMLGALRRKGRDLPARGTSSPVTDHSSALGAADPIL